MSSHQSYQTFCVEQCGSSYRMLSCQCSGVIKHPLYTLYIKHPPLLRLHRALHFSIQMCPNWCGRNITEISQKHDRNITEISKKYHRNITEISQLLSSCFWSDVCHRWVNVVKVTVTKFLRSAVCSGASSGATRQYELKWAKSRFYRTWFLAFVTFSMCVVCSVQYVVCSMQIDIYMLSVWSVQCPVSCV